MAQLRDEQNKCTDCGEDEFVVITAEACTCCRHCGLVVDIGVFSEYDCVSRTFQDVCPEPRPIDKGWNTKIDRLDGVRHAYLSGVHSESSLSLYRTMCTILDLDDMNIAVLAFEIEGRYSGDVKMHTGSNAVIGCRLACLYSAIQISRPSYFPEATAFRASIERLLAETEKLDRRSPQEVTNCFNRAIASAFFKGELADLKQTRIGCFNPLLYKVSCELRIDAKDEILVHVRKFFSAVDGDLKLKSYDEDRRSKLLTVATIVVAALKDKRDETVSRLSEAAGFEHKNVERRRESIYACLKRERDEEKLSMYTGFFHVERWNKAKRTADESNSTKGKRQKVTGRGVRKPDETTAECQLKLKRPSKRPRSRKDCQATVDCTLT